MYTGIIVIGYSHKIIAQKLNRHRSSIDQEAHRSVSGTDYIAETAHATYKAHHQHSKPKGKCSDDLIATVEEKLRATWSPEQIANAVTLGVISFKTIYNWLYGGQLPIIHICNLQHKGKRRKAEKRGKFFMGTPIGERPKDVKDRGYLWSLGARQHGL